MKKSEQCEERLGFLLTDMARNWRCLLDREIGRGGMDMPTSSLRTLLHVVRLGQAKQTAIAESMGLEPMTVSSHLDRLESQRLIVRRRDPSDRRAKLVLATPLAEELLERICPVIDQLFSKLFHGVAEEQRDLVITAIQRIQVNIDRRQPKDTSCAHGSRDAHQA